MLYRMLSYIVSLIYHVLLYSTYFMLYYDIAHGYSMCQIAPGYTMRFESHSRKQCHRGCGCSYSVCLVDVLSD